MFPCIRREQISDRVKLIKLVVKVIKRIALTPCFVFLVAVDSKRGQLINVNSVVRNKCLEQLCMLIGSDLPKSVGQTRSKHSAGVNKELAEPAVVDLHLVIRRYVKHLFRV